MNAASPTLTPDAPPAPSDWPMEVRAVFDALTRPAPVERERRRHPRTPCHGQAKVHLPADGKLAAASKPASIYLRDYCPGAVSFLTQTWLAPERVVELEMATPDGNPANVRCKVHRCRQFCDTWFEGVLRVITS